MDLEKKEIDEGTSGSAVEALEVRSEGSCESKNFRVDKSLVEEPDSVIQEGGDEEGSNEMKLPDGTVTQSVIHIHFDCDIGENAVLPVKENELNSKNKSIEELPEKLSQECSFHGQQSLRLAGGNESASVAHINSEQVSVRVDELETKVNELDSKKVRPQELTQKVNTHGDACVIDVPCSKDKTSDESSDGEVVCRICHLGADQSPKAVASTTSDSNTTIELIRLGCVCKDELGIAHRHCAEAWFKLKGNRLCEICGETVKNVMGVGDSRFMEEWNERRFFGNDGSSERGRCWQGQAFCNFLMACLVIAFVLPWFFRVNMF